jgi:Ca-activated chloride channel family protein
MTLHWPWALSALLAFPLLLGYRWWDRRRRRRNALRVSNLALIRAALPGKSPWRRRIPVWLFAFGLVVLACGATRPEATVVAPSDASGILLALDVSGSMCSTDVSPNRLTAAENAARDFINAQHAGTKIGLVVFTGIAALQVPPTTDRDQLLKALKGLRTARGTAIGLGILTALDAIADLNPDVAHTGVQLPTNGTNPPAPGTDFEPDTIVLLTDGANTQGVDPVTAAQQSAARKVRIYPIGFGTTTPAPMVCSADQIGGDPFGGGGFGGFRGNGGFGGFGGGGRNVQDLDATTLTTVATVTGGKYFQAKDAKELTDILLNLPSSIVLQHKKSELTIWFALAGALLVMAAVVLAQWWNRATSARAQ